MASFAFPSFDILGAAIAPKEVLAIDEWAEQYRYIGKGTAANPGPWDNDQVPWMIEPMHEASISEEIVFASSAQISKTESLILNTIGYFIHYDPTAILCVLPDWDTCDEISRDRFDPMIRDTPVMRGLISKERASAGDGIRGSTKQVKRFPGGRLNFVTANSASKLASKPIRVVVIDELDRCQVNSEGDIYLLARKRTETFQRNRLIIRCSTPTLKEGSPIMDAYEKTDQRRYFVDCPHCQTEQQLEWKQVKWETVGEHRNVWYECPHCSAHWSERDRRHAVSEGRWKPTAKPAPGFERVAGFWIWAGYSLFTTLEAIVQEFYTAKDDKTKLQVFVNTVLGQTWEDPDAEKLEHSELQKRCEPYERSTVPKDCLVLTAGVDVQIDKLVLVIRGWTKTLESYLVDWIELYGDTAQDPVWEQLGQAIAQTFKHDAGVEIKIRRCAIDSSAYTNRVYNKVTEFRKRIGIDCLAIKGNPSIDKPIYNRPSKVDLTVNGKPRRRGISLYSVGTGSAKTLLYQRVEIEPGLPYSYHWPHLPEDYFLELTSERKVTRFSKGRATMSWELIPNRRNEVLDCEVYNLFCAVSLGIDRASFNWKAVEESVLSGKPDNKGDAEQPRKNDKVPSRRKRSRRSDWATRY
ncbi:MAG: phage terminase large subunit family protein [Leptolyngbyaceae cyanobacterium MO_188.B28]|nr:phage terminase large subunit family protein [Leptolyngbyaceae cyanobacterium MO_188.B28]